MRSKERLFQKKYLKIHIASIVAFILYAGLLQVTKIYSPIWYLTGWMMPTTGVTRAWLQFVQGNTQAAFAYNPMFLLAPVLALAIYRYLFFSHRRDLVIALICAVLFMIGNVLR